MDKNIFDIEVKKEGWEKMRTILDKELPVKKRRFLPFILLFLVFGIIGITFLYSKASKKELKEIITKERVQYIDRESIKPIENKIIKIDTVSNTSKAINNKKTNTQYPENRNQKQKLKKQRISEIEKKQYNIVAAEDGNNKIETNIISHSPEIVENENHKDQINKISTIGISSLLSFEKKFVPEYDFNYMVINRKNKTKLLDPFAGIKLHTYNYKEFSPKFEFNLGTYFNLNDKFSFGAGIAFLQRKLVYQVIEEENYVVYNNNNVEKTRSKYSYNIEQEEQSKWLFELMIMEKYNFTGKTAININGGIVLSGLSFSKKSLDVVSTDYEGRAYNPENIKPIVFFGINLNYALSDKIRAGLGYKYYYSETYIFNDNNTEIYSQKLVNKKYSSKFFLGVNYFFR
jgi:hypothetical protein